MEKEYIPVGYTLGVVDTQEFNNWMNRDWLLQIRRLYPLDMEPKSDLEKFLTEIIHEDCTFPDILEEFPSHLHIDLLPIAQKQGYGKRMISTFIEKLKEKGSVGLHLSVGERNQNAIAFYKKLGFSELKRERGSVLMVMSLVT